MKTTVYLIIFNKGEGRNQSYYLNEYESVSNPDDAKMWYTKQEAENFRLTFPTTFKSDVVEHETEYA